MLNTQSLRSGIVTNQVKRSSPRPEQNWIQTAIEGLRSGQEAQHAYSLLRARGTRSGDASRIVVDKYFASSK